MNINVIIGVASFFGLAYIMRYIIFKSYFKSINNETFWSGLLVAGVISVVGVLGFQSIGKTLGTFLISDYLTNPNSFSWFGFFFLVIKKPIIILTFLIGGGYAFVDIGVSLLTQIFAFTIGVGACEEFFKFFSGILIFSFLQKRLPASSKNNLLFVAMCLSGIGFGAIEAIQYTLVHYIPSNSGVNDYLLRVFLCIPFHTCLVLSSYLNFKASNSEYQEFDLFSQKTYFKILFFCAPSILLHGLYDAFCGHDIQISYFIFAISLCIFAMRMGYTSRKLSHLYSLLVAALFSVLLYFAYEREFYTIDPLLDEPYSYSNINEQSKFEGKKFNQNGFLIFYSEKKSLFINTDTLQNNRNLAFVGNSIELNDNNGTYSSLLHDLPTEVGLLHSGGKYSYTYSSEKEKKLCMYGNKVYSLSNKISDDDNLEFNRTDYSTYQDTICDVFTTNLGELEKLYIPILINKHKDNFYGISTLSQKEDELISRNVPNSEINNVNIYRVFSAQLPRFMDFVAFGDRSLLLFLLLLPIIMAIISIVFLIEYEGKNFLIADLILTFLILIFNYPIGDIGLIGEILAMSLLYVPIILYLTLLILKLMKKLNEK